MGWAIKCEAKNSANSSVQFSLTPNNDISKKSQKFGA